MTIEKKLPEAKPYLLPKKLFLKKIVRNVVLGILASAFSLWIGMLGYHHYEKLSWLDSYLNAAMILSGMGPIWNPVTPAGKFFAGTYALFSGIVFLIIMAIIFGPIIHRFLRKIHLEDK